MIIIFSACVCKREQARQRTWRQPQSRKDSLLEPTCLSLWGWRTPEAAQHYNFVNGQVLALSLNLLRFWCLAFILKGEEAVEVPAYWNLKQLTLQMCIGFTLLVGYCTTWRSKSGFWCFETHLTGRPAYPLAPECAVSLYWLIIMPDHLQANPYRSGPSHSCSQRNFLNVQSALQTMGLWSPGALLRSLQSSSSTDRDSQSCLSSGCAIIQKVLQEDMPVGQKLAQQFQGPGDTRVDFKEGGGARCSRVMYKGYVREPVEVCRLVWRPYQQACEEQQDRAVDWQDYHSNLKIRWRSCCCISQGCTQKQASRFRALN